MTARPRGRAQLLLGLAVAAVLSLAAASGGPATDRQLLLAAGIGLALMGGGVLLLLRDRAAMLRTEAALRRRADRLAAAVAQARDGVMLFDPAGGLELWNEPALAATGLPPALFRRDTTLAQLAAATQHWPGAPLAAAHPAASQPAVETRAGDKALEVWRRSLPDGGQIVAVADISRRVEAEAVAHQAHKMEVLGQLTGGVAHDFNNHMQIVSANLEMLDGRVAGDPWLSERLAGAMAGVDRAARLTRHLLAYARQQPPTPEAVDVGVLLLAMEDMLRRTLGEAVAVEMMVEGGLWPSTVDPQELETALLNLAINARDAMPDGGRLTIEAANASFEAGHLASGAGTLGDCVTVVVSDTGTGMKPEQLARATEPFYTTKAPGRGTGLGLAMVHAFARRSAGALTLHSEAGHGTTVRLSLPRGETAPLPAPAPARPVELAQGELVLVVEDDEAVRAASGQALRELRYRTVEADSAAAALALLDDGLRPDLLFTDVVMPGQPNARVLAARAREVVPGLAVVFASGYGEGGVTHAGRLDSGVTLISKPWRLGDLAQQLRLALAQAPQPPLRMLLVEDEPLIRMATADLLVEMGHTVDEADDGAAAMRLLRARRIDLLIVDLGLPDIDGLELAEAARAVRPRLRVIVTTGRDAPAAGTLHRPEMRWLLKPYDRSALRDAIDGATAASSGYAAA